MNTTRAERMEVKSRMMRSAQEMKFEESDPRYPDTKMLNSMRAKVAIHAIGI